MSNDAMLKRAIELVVNYFTFTRGKKWSRIKPDRGRTWEIKRCSQEAVVHGKGRQSMKETKPTVIIINGAGGVGKDTICGVFRGHSLTLVYSSIYPIKHIAYEIGWKGEKTDKARKMLSDLKDICTEYNDLPFKYMAESLEDTKNDEDLDFAIFHIREPQEIDKFKRYVIAQGYIFYKGQKME